MTRNTNTWNLTVNNENTCDNTYELEQVEKEMISKEGLIHIVEESNVYEEKKKTCIQIK